MLIDHSVSGSLSHKTLLTSQIENTGALVVHSDLSSPISALDQLISELESGPVAVVDARLLTGQAMIDALFVSPWTSSSVLATKSREPDYDRAARVASKRVLSSATALHRVSSPTHTLLGVVRLDNSEETLTALKNSRSYLESLTQDIDFVDLVTLIVVRSGHEVTVIDPAGLCSRNSDDRDSTVATLEKQDDTKVRFERAVRSNDGFYSTFVLRKFSRIVTKIALKRGWTPNNITIASLVIAFVASAFFATGQHVLLAVGAVLVQLAIIVDCSDGEVARYTGVSSALGAWLDAATDRIKEYVMYAALALGASRHHENLWKIVFALIVLQTVRHLSDYNFVAVRGARDAEVTVVPLAQIVDQGKASAGSLMDASESLNRRRPVYWIKRVIYLPIGERWLIISIGALLGSPHFIFTTLLTLGILALGYVSFGRIMRSRTWKHAESVSGCDIVERQIDAGPLTQWIFEDGAHPLTGRFGWAVPALSRLVELGLVAVMCQSYPIAFWWLFAVSFHHYDTLYRSLSGHTFPRRLTRLGLGVEGRLLVIFLSSLGFIVPLRDVLILGGMYFVVLFIGVASRQWIRELQSAS